MPERTRLETARAAACLLALAVVFVVVFAAVLVAVLVRSEDPSGAVLWGAVLAGAVSGWAAAYVPWRVAVWRGWIRRGDAAEAAHTVSQALDAFS